MTTIKFWPAGQRHSALQRTSADCDHEARILRRLYLNLRRAGLPPALARSGVFRLSAEYEGVDEFAVVAS